MRTVKKGAFFFLIAIFLAYSACDSPVETSYYEDTGKIKGGEKPTPPCLDSVLYQDSTIYIIFYTDSQVSPCSPALDPETGNNDLLIYFVYETGSSNPPPFTDEALYYSNEYYLGYVEESFFSDEPKIVSFTVDSGFSGEIYIWMTSFDGGRESDHSIIRSVTVE